MQLQQLYQQNRKVISLEFFPPKQSEKLPATLDLVRHLGEFGPDFMTVTYGAGGSTRGLTSEITSYIVNQIGLPAMAHLTCVGHSVAEIDQVLDQFDSLGINNILALRGDPPKGQNSFTAHPQGFSCARDLVTHIAQRGKYGIAVAGYPEGHLEAESPEADITYLKQKVDAGAELILTQLFFDADMYSSFSERARHAGISVPIVPGIMPISNVKQLERFTRMCGASIPLDLHRALKRIESDQSAVKEFGIERAIDLCQKLLERDAPGVHLYTLNKSAQIEKIIEAIR